MAQAKHIETQPIVSKEIKIGFWGRVNEWITSADEALHHDPVADLQMVISDLENRVQSLEGKRSNR